MPYALARFGSLRARWRATAYVGLVGVYAALYAPYGINETDCGYLSGLAWRVLHGQALYADTLYIRPPMSVWLRALEMQLLPHEGGLFWERVLFFVKTGIYAWTCAALLNGPGVRRWALALLGFVVSVHCAPPGAWYTTDGILLCAIGFAFVPKRRWVTAGLCVGLAMLCKQSFYPAIGLLIWAAAWQGGVRGAVMSVLGAVLPVGAFGLYLMQNGLWAAFKAMNSGTASADIAWRRGFWDFAQIDPRLMAVTAAFALPFALAYRRRPALAWLLWAGWLTALIGSYGFTIWQRGEFTLPFSQTRLLFIFAAIGAALLFFHKKTLLPPMLLPLLGLSWCAAISEGYNLPILLATPWIWVIWETGCHLSGRIASAPLRAALSRWAWAAALAGCIAVFRLGYAYGYRDGRRAEMRVDVGAYFPALRGIRTTPERAELYRELKSLSAEFPNFAVLPYFSSAHWITRSQPFLPSDWTNLLETNGMYHLFNAALERDRPTIFFEKKYAATLPREPKLIWTKKTLERMICIRETPNWQVYRLPD
ncbi:MAG: hypothetical protein ACK4NS_00305 [Saprospiraceae bacterium]